MKQRILSFLLCVGLLFCLTACGGDKDTAATTYAAAAELSEAAEAGAEASMEASSEAVNGLAMMDMTVNIAVVYPENIPEEAKAQYGLQRLDGSYALLDDDIYGDGESILISEGELARFMSAPVDGLLPAILHSEGAVLGQELNGGAYITITQAENGVLDVTVDYTNEDVTGRIQGPVRENTSGSGEASGNGEVSDGTYTVGILAFRYPEGHDAASDPGGIRVYEAPEDWSVYTDYTEAVAFEMAAGESFYFSILPTRANTGMSFSGARLTAILTDDLPRYVVEGGEEMEIVYSDPGPISIGAARQDICFTVEVIYPDGVAEGDKADYGLQQLDSGMNPMEGIVYGDGDVFTVPYAYWAGFAPLRPELAELRYSEAVAYTINSGDIPCTIFRSAESGEVTITVDYSGE